MLNDLINYFSGSISFLGLFIISLLIIFAFVVVFRLIIQRDLNKRQTTIEIDQPDEEEEEEPEEDDIDSI